MRRGRYEGPARSADPHKEVSLLVRIRELQLLQTESVKADHVGQSPEEADENADHWNYFQWNGMERPAVSNTSMFWNNRQWNRKEFNKGLVWAGQGARCSTIGCLGPGGSTGDEERRDSEWNPKEWRKQERRTWNWMMLDSALSGPTHALSRF